MNDVRVDCIILAAGLSRRFGFPKFQAVINGKPMISHVAGYALKTSLSSVTIVSRDSSVKPLVQGNVNVVINRRPELGISESIRVGLDSIPRESDGVMILPGDEPLIGESVMQSLVDAFTASPLRAVSCSVGHDLVSPAIFPSAMYMELRKLEGDRGGRSVLLHNMDSVTAIQVEEWRISDIDTQEDVARVERIGKEMGVWK